MKRNSLIFIGIVALLFSTTFYADENIEATKEYHEKYLKGKITPELKSDVAKNIKMEDFKTYKEFDIATITDGNNTNIEKSISSSIAMPSKESGEVKDWVSSKAYSKQFDEHIDYILKDQAIGEHTLSKEDLSNIKTKSMLGSNFDEHIYIVISSSIPLEEIQEYFKQVEGKEHITFIMRGLIGKGVKEFEPTLKYMNKLLTKDPYIEESEDNRFNINLHINPKVTQRYKIDRVPAIIYVQNHDGLLEDSVPVEESNEKYWISYGMGSIDYVVERINKEANSLWLTSLLEKDSFFRSKGGK